MELDVLSRDEFSSGSVLNEPTIRFTYAGVVYLNRHAVRVLNLIEKGNKGYSPVLICREPKAKHNFGIFKDAGGWVLRDGASGGVMFNCVGLARHIIDATWDMPGACHAVGSVKPRSMVFRVAAKPWDDDKNRDVYALLRKKT
jgi:hypothetical protein